MMPCKIISLDENELVIDLDRVVDLLEGEISHKKGWTALIVFDPISQKFIELRDSPQNIRGNSKSEAVEVTPEYIQKEFSISKDKLAQFMNNPFEWRFLDLKD